MLKKEVVAKVLGVSVKSVYNYYKDQKAKPIIALLEKSFSNEDLEDFLNNQEITVNDINDDWVIQNKLNTELINRIERLEEKVKKLEEDK